MEPWDFWKFFILNAKTEIFIHFLRQTHSYWAGNMHLVNKSQTWNVFYSVINDEKCRKTVAAFGILKIFEIVWMIPYSEAKKNSTDTIFKLEILAQKISAKIHINVQKWAQKCKNVQNFAKMLKNTIILCKNAQTCAKNCMQNQKISTAWKN